ncbi:MAG: haloacid dehalogenase type II [Halobacteriales archaeon]|nr:haloacid dehalogenase type II [Halobacteriales archaeon]
MAFDPDRVETITFDSYSTIVDVESATEALADQIEHPAPAEVAAVWRERSLTYAAISNYLGEYEPFWEMVRHGLEYALAAHDITLTEERIDTILGTYHDLDAFEDVRPGLERLTALGYSLYIVSNGSPEMLETMIESADIAGLVTDAISADEIETYKIDPAIYRHAAARTGTPARRIAHVSAGWFDACGAKNVGMQGIWVNRDGEPPEPWGPTPDLTVDGFHELTAAFE